LKKDVNRDEIALSSLKQQIHRLNAEKKLLQYRSRKYRLFPKAEQGRQLRRFNSAPAKLKNAVKELHHQASSFLTKQYDMTALPIFQTMNTTKPSNSRSHTFNETLLSLKHFVFHQLLQSKCALRGKTLVVSSEMSSSLTCGHYSRLNVGLGAAEVFRCPHCGYVAGRDANAAFTILRFVCGGPLATFDVQQ
jgi:transposase